MLWQICRGKLETYQYNNKKKSTQAALLIFPLVNIADVTSVPPTSIPASWCSRFHGPWHHLTWTFENKPKPTLPHSNLQHINNLQLSYFLSHICFALKRCTSLISMPSRKPSYVAWGMLYSLDIFKVDRKIQNDANQAETLSLFKAKEDRRRASVCVV